MNSGNKKELEELEKVLEELKQTLTKERILNFINKSLIEGSKIEQDGLTYKIRGFSIIKTYNIGSEYYDINSDSLSKSEHFRGNISHPNISKEDLKEIYNVINEKYEHIKEVDRLKRKIDAYRFLI